MERWRRAEQVGRRCEGARGKWAAKGGAGKVALKRERAGRKHGEKVLNIRMQKWVRAGVGQKRVQRAMDGTVRSGYSVPWMGRCEVGREGDFHAPLQELVV